MSNLRTPFSVNIADILDETADISWENHNSLGRVGADISKLFNDVESGQQVALIRCAPGARAEKHVHTGHETFVILDGDFQDESGIFKKGDIVVYPPNSSHSWKSITGAVILAVWGGRVTARS
jgi:anti-sigma factor ChrR (cupin superfamily)